MLQYIKTTAEVRLERTDHRHYWTKPKDAESVCCTQQNAELTRSQNSIVKTGKLFSWGYTNVEGSSRSFFSVSVEADMVVEII